MTDETPRPPPPRPGTAAATSPQAVESTLARISDEVMQEAIERNERAARKMN